MLLEARNIRKTYGSLTVLEDVSLTLDIGQSIALTGESGSGKSTLIHLLAALDAPDAGSIVLGGTDITDFDERARADLRRSSIGIVFQQFNLIPSLTAGANLAFQARLAGRHDAALCADLARALGLSDHLTKYPEALSGGQQQRIALGRALAARPRLLLADEPTGNLDETTAAATLDLMLDLTRQSGAGLIMATHSMQNAARLDARAHLHAGRLE